MSYNKSTIAKVIAEIEQKKIFLPALQRKFVWGKHQIELLFDSLMRNYPFGTFLFWKLPKQKAQQYVFYEFLTEYNERDPYNRRKTGAYSHDEIIGVLDGQQRLSSMYIGLMGTHTEKAPYKRRSNAAAYEKTSLYLNLLSAPYRITPDGRMVEIEDHNYEFRFLTETAAAAGISKRVHAEDGTLLREEPMFWMKAGEDLMWDREPEFDQVIEKLAERCQTAEQREALSSQKRQVKRCLETLHRRVTSDELINYFAISKDDLEDILKIFVRVNSGGTILSKTDLLFSTIVATWDDGRERIEDLLKQINAKGEGFAFGNEFLMRSCLVLSDGPVLFKVNSFRSENVQKIKDEWPRITQSLAATVDLLVEFGFNGELLTSQNAVIIIAYYLHRGGGLGAGTKVALRKYLIHALLNGVYGSSQDQLLSTLRNGFRTEVNGPNGEKSHKGRFVSLTFEDVLNIKLPQQKSLSVMESDLERFLGHTKGPAAFFVLTLLYPHLRYNDAAFHQDHMHPFSGFSKEELAVCGIPEAQHTEWYARRDCVPNLQLLNERRNLSKNATPLADWVGRMNAAERSRFISENYVPEDDGFEFRNFITFYAQRKERLREKLRLVLAMAPSQKAGSAPVSSWSGDETENEESEE